MAANPYVTVPAGSASQQALYLQALYRNAALAQEYAQQPTGADLWAKAIPAAASAGLSSYFNALDQNAKASQAYTVEGMQQQGLWDRQQALFGEERAKAEAAARADAMKRLNMGAAQTGLWQGMQRPPPYVQGYESPPDPTAFSDYGAQTVTPPQPQVGDVLSGLGPLAGYLGHEDISAAQKAYATKPQEPGLSESQNRAITLGLALIDTGVPENVIAGRQLIEMAQTGVPPALMQPNPVKVAEGNKARLQNQALEGTPRDQLTSPGSQRPVTPEAMKLTGMEPTAPKDPLAGLSTAGVLQSIRNAQPGSPVFQTPSAKMYGTTEAEIRAGAERTLFGGGAPVGGGLYGYESAIAGSRTAASTMARETVEYTSTPIGSSSEYGRWVGPGGTRPDMKWSAQEAEGHGAVKMASAGEAEALRQLRMQVPFVRELAGIIPSYPEAGSSDAANLLAAGAQGARLWLAKKSGGAATILESFKSRAPMLAKLLGDTGNIALAERTQALLASLGFVETQQSGAQKLRLLTDFLEEAYRAKGVEPPPDLEGIRQQAMRYLGARPVTNSPTFTIPDDELGRFKNPK